MTFPSRLVGRGAHSNPSPSGATVGSKIGKPMACLLHGTLMGRVTAWECSRPAQPGITHE